MSQSETKQYGLRDSHVVDIDVHIEFTTDEILRDLASRMDDPWGRYVNPDTGQGAVYPSDGWDRTLGGQKDVFYEDTTTVEAIDTHLIDSLSVDHPILNTTIPVDAINRTERAINEASALNDLLLDRFLDERPEWYGAITVPTRDPTAAAAEIDRLAGEDQIVGAYLYGGVEFQRPLGHPSMDEMWAAMEDNDLTPIIHSTSFQSKSAGLRELGHFFSVHSIGPAFSGLWTLTSLIANGTVEKFPELEFVLIEYGLSWVPHAMARLNREYGQWRSELPLLEQSPERYIRDSFYFANQPLGEFESPDHLRSIIDIIGADSIMFATDHPHYDFDNPATVDAYLRHLEPEERERVLSGNAIEAFGLDL